MFMPFFREILVTSRTYRFAMLAMFAGHFILTWIVMQSLFDATTSIATHLIVRALIESFLLVAVCHCLIRPYLRLHMLGLSVTVAMIGRAFVYFIGISIIFFLISFSLGKTEFFSATDISQINIEMAGGQIASEINIWLISIFGIGESFVTLATWGVLYLVFKYQKNKRELQSEMTRIQIQQLTSQLSPHFLFNTLNSIRALIYIDQDRASEAITLLSDLLRSQTQTQMKSQTSFKEDLATTKKYLSIESIRFENRMEVIIDVDEDVLNQKLPTLTLLTLTENAIKHGISVSSRKGFIKLVSKRLSPTRWFISVENSVYGDENKSGTKVGLKNVQKRFSLLFGNNFTFDVALKNQTYTVNMELPYVESIVS